MTTIRRAARFATVATLIQIGSGGLVRATGSGDGCPDWPRCFGSWIPPLEYHALIEWSHRFVGSIAIASVLWLAVVAIVHGRDRRLVAGPALAAVAGIFVQAGIGAYIVASKQQGDLAPLGPNLVTLHIATAMLLAAALVFLWIRVARADGAGEAASRAVQRLAAWAAAGVFAVIVVGAYVRGRGAGLAFPDWPLMNGRVVPALNPDTGAHFAHRTAVLAVGVLLAALVVRARRERAQRPAVALLAHLTAGLYLVQALVGAAQVWTRLDAPWVALHVLLAACTWAAAVGAAVLARAPVAERQTRRARVGRPEPAPISGAQVLVAVQPAARARDVARAYIQLTKPRIIVLLLITTVPSMMLAAQGWPSSSLVLATLAGGMLAAAAANTFNCYLDRDIDAVMSRTRSRPLPSHRVEPIRALLFGLALQVLSWALMVASVNVEAALLAQGAIVFYVFVYTLILKRTTPQNIVIGGAAGAVPCLVGWAAVTGRVEAAALVLFGIVFLWTPPHFWALAMRFKSDYARAGIPMLPVVASARTTQRQILAYTVATVGLSLALGATTPVSPFYLAAATGLGAWFLAHALRLHRSGSARDAMGLFRVSISYLALLFAAVGVDAGVRPL